ncbi:unnamed protein product [Closterium sp. NIES-53]
MGAGRESQYPFMERAVYRQFLKHQGRGLAVLVSMLQKRSAKYMKHQMPGVNWRASFCWATCFRARWHLVRRVKTKMGQKLAADCKAKVESFWEFVRQMRSLHDYPLDLIVNTDQTPLFLEMPAEQTIEMKGVRTVHVRRVGYEKERVTVMLACMASGIKLPPYMVFKRKTISKVPIPASKHTSAVCVIASVAGSKKRESTLPLRLSGEAIPEELVKKAFVTCGISTPIDGSEDHLILAHMQEKGEVEVLDDVNDLVNDELVVNPFYAEVPMLAEELQAATQEDDAAEEDAEAVAAEEEGVVLEEAPPCPRALCLPARSARAPCLPTRALPAHALPAPPVCFAHPCAALPRKRAACQQPVPCPRAPCARPGCSLPIRAAAAVTCAAATAACTAAAAKPAATTAACSAAAAKRCCCC